MFLKYLRAHGILSNVSVLYTSRAPVKLPYLQRAPADESLDYAVFKMGLFTCSSSKGKASPVLAMSGGGVYSPNLKSL